MEIVDYLHYNSVLILSYFFISLFVLILKYLTLGASTKLLFSSYRSSLANPLTYVRFFTHILGHEDWRHFSGNFIYILLIGPLIEEKYGTWNLLIMILITAFCISVLNHIIGRKRIYGASGIVFMLIVLSSFVNIDLTKIPMTLILIFMFFIVNEILDAFTKNDGVSHFGHLVGAVCGCVLGYMASNGIIFVDLIKF